MAHLSAGPLAPHARLAHGWEPEPRERVKAAFLSSLSRRREPAAPTPSTIRSSRAFKHPNGAALRIAPLFGPALSDHVRAGPLPTGLAESREGRSRDEAPAAYSRRARPLRRDLPHALCGDPGARADHWRRVNLQAAQPFPVDESESRLDFRRTVNRYRNDRQTQGAWGGR